MRPKVEPGRKSVTKPVSLYPQQAEYARSRSFALQMSLSRYFQKLIEYDRANNVMAKVLAMEARQAAKPNGRG